MFSNMKIGSRLLLLIAALMVTLILTSTIALRGLGFATDATEKFNQQIIDQTRIQSVLKTVQTDILGTITALNLGSITWNQGKADLAAARTKFNANWKNYTANKSENHTELSMLQPKLEQLMYSINQMEQLANDENRAKLTLFSINDLDFLVSPFLNSLSSLIQEKQIRADESFVEISKSENQYFTITLLILIAGILVSLILGFIIYRSITIPVTTISETVKSIVSGDYEVRTKITGNDELGQLGETFDNMLDERLSTLANIKDENEKLNMSVIDLLQAVSNLSLNKNLAVKVPVSEDVIGPVADSLNLLTTEMVDVLRGVNTISVAVSDTSSQIKQQSDTILLVADAENKEVELTAKELAKTADGMAQIAILAQGSNKTADMASTTTSSALEAVTRTVSGINNIRDTIRETEKRIKRLGERSQEINGTINLINSISERTHILALNASMHAASAGEAGRGFAVVADEVQRLAENAREATSEISTLVNNIQTETGDTVNTMNQLIQEVVEGTRLAERAGEEMNKTQKTTNELVASVQKIASSSRIQAKLSKSLLIRAKSIKLSSQKTSDQLVEQSKNTDRLVSASTQLIDAVGIFKLPKAI